MLIAPIKIIKVVFGFCITDCSGTGSNSSGGDAVKVLQDLKIYNNGVFSCNGGAFFWVAEHDANGSWSDAVSVEVVKTTGCSSLTTTTGATTTAGTTTTVISTTTTTKTTTTKATGSCIPRGVNPDPEGCSKCCSGACKGRKCT